MLQKLDKVLNEYLFTVFTVEKDMTSSEFSKVNGDVLGIVCITVDKVLNCMKVDISSGPDHVYRRTLLESREEMAETRAEICASSIDTCI